MYDRLRIIQKNERIRTLITNNLVPRAFPSENGRGKKRPGKEFGLEASSYQEVLNPKFLPLSSACAEAPAGYSSKNSTNRKIESARGRWEEGKGGSSILSFPFPSCRAPSFLPSPPTTQRGLRGERVLTRALKRQRQD